MCGGSTESSRSSWSQHCGWFVVLLSVDMSWSHFPRSLYVWTPGVGFGVHKLMLGADILRRGENLGLFNCNCGVRTLGLPIRAKIGV